MLYEPTLIERSGSPPVTLHDQAGIINSNLELISSAFSSLVSGFDFQDSVLDKDLTAPPGSPVEGARYIVAGTATGAWATHETEIAQYTDSAWEFIIPNKGYCLTVEDEFIMYVFNDSIWVPTPSLPGAITGTAGETLSQFDLVYSSSVDGKYYKATANDTEAKSNAVGIVTGVGGIAQDAQGQIQISPTQIVSGSWTWTPDKELYLNIAGDMTHDPSSLAWSKPVGYAITSTKILFWIQTGWSNSV
jgi:hypothetical protein